MYAAKDLRSLLHLFEQKGCLQRIRIPVDPHLEIAEIHRRVVQKKGPCLLFEQVKGSSFPVVTNLFGTEERVHLALGNRLNQTLEQLLRVITDPPSSFSQWLKFAWANKQSLGMLTRLGFKRCSSSPLLEGRQGLTLDDLPFLTSWPKDGGPFLTLPLVYTQSLSQQGPRSTNFGMYRIQRFDAYTAGLHFQIGKGGGFHFWEAEQQGVNMPVSIFLGGSPALIASAVAPLPEHVNELLLTSALMGQKLDLHQTSDWPHPLIREAEFAILGYAQSGKRKLEGPFGDHYGYYSLAHDFPYMQVEKVLARPGAIYPATIVGKPPQEDLYLGNWLQELLRPIIRLVMPSVLNLWSYGETGFHALAAAQVQERYERECLSHALRILGEGQLALTKCLLITDQPIDLKDIKLTLKTILERMQPETDLFTISNLCLDTLDYTGPSLNKGSRGIFVGIGKVKRQLPETFQLELPNPFKRARAFCPGCLLVEGLPYEQDPSLAKELAHDKLADWPLILLVDDIDACKTSHDFLWNVFMRFEPARDLYTRHEIHYYQASHRFPLVIDARMKPSYPEVVEVDDRTREIVDDKWQQYGFASTLA